MRGVVGKERVGFGTVRGFLRQSAKVNLRKKGSFEQGERLAKMPDKSLWRPGGMVIALQVLSVQDL
jgi:hypothetical protein